MSVLEHSIPACMNSANLFPSPPLSPNANIHGRLCCSSPPPNGPSHKHDHTSTPLPHRPATGREKASSPRTRNGLLDSSIASPAVAAASIACASSRRLPTPPSDPRDSYQPP
ncbi:hypothetical protein SAMD00023353_3601020 [Rosellinia necatrix]|uniref:Uncharacterized protein n=1 Tax=Rosellinia necatrix TaxID=77044 RepID=A0A1S8AA25_ROSNE|nr:hypothetical protein SAMD00023353_3601020 [Rosellinia necatrix]